MRLGKTLRARLSWAFLLAALLPVFIFSIISQEKLRNSLDRNLEDWIGGNLRNSNRSLDMVLDKYETILIDMCTDDIIVESVRGIISGQDDMNVNSSVIRHSLSHICYSNSGIEGITIILENGKTIFYDRLNASSTTSAWAGKVSIPVMEKGAIYQGVTAPITTGNVTTYVFQISRKVVDYRDIHEYLGSAVLSINQKEIQAALKSGMENKTYLLDGNVVVSSPDERDIGKKISSLKDTKENRYTKIENEKSGLIICNEQSLSEYKKAIVGQIEFLLIVVLIACIIVLLLIMFLTKPYIVYVDSFVDAMNKVESGDFEVDVVAEEQMPIEIKRITNGFNEMVGHMDDLIGQVKEAVVEQKNAELSALEAQIDPHFLYNTLDTINWKAIENEQYDISEMVGALADILRYSVKNAGGITTVRQELGWLRHYSMLQGVKLGKPLIIEEKIPEELMGYQIHKLLLQPFVENAIKYAFREHKGECRLVVMFRRSDDQIHIIIQDNGIGIEVETLRQLNDETAKLEGHVGIVNVRKRLKLYYGDEATVYFESMEGGGTKVHLFIPERRMQGESRYS